MSENTIAGTTPSDLELAAHVVEALTELRTQIFALALHTAINFDEVDPEERRQLEELAKQTQLEAFGGVADTLEVLAAKAFPEILSIQHRVDGDDDEGAFAGFYSDTPN